MSLNFVKVIKQSAIVIGAFATCVFSCCFDKQEESNKQIPPLSSVKKQNSQGDKAQLDLAQENFMKMRLNLAQKALYANQNDTFFKEFKALKSSPEYANICRQLFLGRVKDLMDAGKYGRAIALIKSVYEINGYNYEEFDRMAFCAENIEDYPTLLNARKTILENSENKKTAHEQYIQALITAKQTDTALEEISKLMSESPYNGKNYLLRARANLSKGDISKAKSDYSDAFYYSSNDYNIAAEAGIFFCENNFLNEFLRLKTVASKSEISTEMSAVLDYLDAYAHLKDGNKDIAIRLFGKTMDAMPLNLDAYLKYANLLAENKRTEVALRALRHIDSKLNGCDEAILEFIKITMQFPEIEKSDMRQELSKLAIKYSEPDCGNAKIRREFIKLLESAISQDSSEKDYYERILKIIKSSSPSK